MAPRVKIQRTDNIGKSAAEHDDFLEYCFIDKRGEIDILSDVDNIQSIVVGRTGVGKTALLKRLEYQDVGYKVIDIKPQDLSIGYISNSNVIQVLHQGNISLDLIFKLLWRNVIAIEVIKDVYEGRLSHGSLNVFERLYEFVTSSRSKDAIRFMEKYEDNFWNETYVRVQKFTEKLEEEFEAEAGVKLGSLFEMNSNYSDNISTELSYDVVHKVQKVINQVHAKELRLIFNLLNDVLSENRQKTYYITIDGLDENWVEDGLRYKLIKALIETCREYNLNVGPSKIIVSLRTDLINRVFDFTHHGGFQEEKYRDLFVEVRWDRVEIVNMLDKRVSHLFESKYTKQDVALRDILPDRVNGIDSAQYIIDRTLLRPRDAISYVNTYISKLDPDVDYEEKLVKDAERPYSEQRLSAICDEWRSDYPHMRSFTKILSLLGEKFHYEDITKRIVARVVNPWFSQNTDSNPPSSSIADSIFKFTDSDSGGYSMIIERIVVAFYLVGLIGVKYPGEDQYQWSFIDGQDPRYIQPLDNLHFAVHPAFHKALRI